MSILGLITGLKFYGKKKVIKNEEEPVGYEAGNYPEPIIKIVKKQPSKVITSSKKKK